MVNSSKQFSSSLIGQRLIEVDYLSEEHLKNALALQKETGLLLGEICLLKNWIHYNQLKECLPKLRSRVGDKLLSLGYITIDQLWLAILEQRHTGRKLGEIIVVRGWIDQSILDKVIN